MTTASNHRQYKDHGPLGDLLLKACRPDSEGIRSIPNLARQIDLAPMSLYKWIRKAKIPPERALMIVENSINPKTGKSSVKLEDFHPYVYK